MITRKQLHRIHELNQAVEDHKNKASELMRIARDRFSDKKHKLTREGKQIEITERTMWHEVFMIGPECDSGKILQREHPEVFAAYRKQDEAAAELKKYCITELGVDYTQMSLSDYLKLTEGMFELFINEGRVPKRRWWHF